MPASVYMVRVMTVEARAWVEENVPLEPWQWWGDSFACESRYVSDLLAGMLEAGLIHQQDYDLFG